MARSEPGTPTLARFREEFLGRRTVPYEMFRAAEILVEQGLAEREQVHAAEVARMQQALDHERTMRQRAEEEVAKVRSLNSSLREEQECLDDGTLVRIRQPRLVGRSLATDDLAAIEHVRPWQLHEVETLLYRLRICGGVDSTEVRFKNGHAEATVPHPEMGLFREERPRVRRTHPLSTAQAAMIVSGCLSLLLGLTLVAIWMRGV